MTKKISFNQRVITDLVVLNPTKRYQLTCIARFRLADRFAALVDQEVLKEEFQKYQFMEDIEIGMEEGGVQKYVDRYLSEIMKKKKTAMGQMQLHK